MAAGRVGLALLGATLCACSTRTGDSARATAAAAAAGKAGGDASGDATRAAFKPLTVGDSAPAFSTVTLDGDSVHVGGANQPITVVNIWATWCTSCREEMADLEALHREFGAHGVRVLAISVDANDVSRVREFVRRERLGFRVAHDPDGIVQGLYQVVGIPETFIVGANGRLLWKSVGNVHPAIDSLRAVLQAASIK